MISYEPIGYIKSQYNNPNETPRNYTVAGDTASVLEINSEYIEGMSDIKPGEKYIVIFHLDRIETYRLKVHKFRNGSVTGLFSTRAPFRPNPIGLSVITVQEVDGNKIIFTGGDMLNGTPVLEHQARTKFRWDLND